MDKANVGLFLICRVPGRMCALPIEHVIETMRALAIEVVAGAPQFVRGLAVIRGEPLPVVDVARLLGMHETSPGRFVAFRVGTRRIALAVEAVLGIRAIAVGTLQALPMLLHEAGSDVIATIGLLDAELLVVLRGAKLLPEDDWMQLDAARAAS